MANKCVSLLLVLCLVVVGVVEAQSIPATPLECYKNCYDKCWAWARTCKFGCKIGCSFSGNIHLHGIYLLHFTCLFITILFYFKITVVLKIQDIIKFFYGYTLKCLKFVNFNFNFNEVSIVKYL